MGELQEAEVTEQIETTPVSETAGGLLRQSREAAGMPVATLAEVMKVPVAKLRALEADDWQAMPDMVFARSLVLSICKTLHVDAAPIMALMPKQQSSQKFSAPGPGPGINEPFRMKAVRSVRDNPSPSSGWKWLGFAALVAVGGGAWYFSQEEVRDAVVASVQERSERAMGNGANASAAQPVAQLAAVPEAAVEPAAASLPEANVAAPSAAQALNPMAAISAAAPPAAAPIAAPSAPAAPIAAPTAAPAATLQAPAIGVASPAAQPLVTPTPLPVAAAPAAVPTAESTAPAALPVSTLRIQASAPTWIQVRAGGKLLEQKTLNAGEFYETHAPKPLSVVVGRADAATVSVEGAALDLVRVARENVARFEVK